MGYSTATPNTIPFQYRSIGGSQTENDCAAAATIGNSSGTQTFGECQCARCSRFPKGLLGAHCSRASTPPIVLEPRASNFSKFRGLLCTLQPGQHVADSLSDLRRLKHLPCLCRLCLSLQKGCALRVKRMLGETQQSTSCCSAHACPPQHSHCEQFGMRSPDLTVLTSCRTNSWADPPAPPTRD